MFQHLLSFGEIPFDDEEQPLTIDEAPVQALVNAQAATVTWLEELDAQSGTAPEAPTIEEAAARAARDAFCSITDPYGDPLQAKSRLMALNAPPAVRHLAGMLSQYDWAYIKQAGEIRGYIVAKLIEHSRAADPKVSLAALKALGTVTEIGAFTERVEISRPPSESTADAIVERLRERLKNYLTPPGAGTGVIEDATITRTTTQELT